MLEKLRTINVEDIDKTVALIDEQIKVSPIMHFAQAFAFFYDNSLSFEEQAAEAKALPLLSNLYAHGLTYLFLPEVTISTLLT